MNRIYALGLGLCLTTFAAMPAMAQEYYDDTTGNSMSNAPMTNYNSGGDRDMATGSVDDIGSNPLLKGNMCRDDQNNPEFPNNRNGCKSSDDFNDHPNRNTANDRRNNNNGGNNN